MTDEWGPWIEHDGKGCPCVGEYVLCEYQNGKTWPPCIATGSIEAWDHSYMPFVYLKVIRYRIRKPRGMVILENLLADMPKVGEVEVI